KKMVNKAFELLDETLELLEIDIDSPFHQFYTAFNMNNGRTDEAVKYMSEYYARNPNPNWFTIIQHSDDESGSDLVDKLEKAVGGKRDLTQINQLFSNGNLGISAYNLLVGTGIE